MENEKWGMQKQVTGSGKQHGSHLGRGSTPLSNESEHVPRICWIGIEVLALASGAKGGNKTDCSSALITVPW
eukprot:1137329-Pelagomonas_calceolata.AAC.4